MFRKRPGRVVASNSRDFSDNQNDIEQRDYVSKCYENNFNTPYHIFKYRCFLSNVTAKLFPLTIIGKNRFDKNLSIGEDSLFAFTVSGKIREIVLTSQNTFYYRRIRPASASRKQRSRKMKLKTGYRLCKAYSKVYFKNPFKNNLPFFISRIIAAIIYVVKNE